MKVKVCMGKNCQNNFATYIVERLKRDKERFNLEKVEIEEVECLGLCEKWPIVKIDKQVLERATPIKASDMVSKRLNNNKQSRQKKERDYEKEDEEVDIKEIIY